MFNPNLFVMKKKLLSILLFLIITTVFAQTGSGTNTSDAFNNGLDQATGNLKNTFKSLKTFLWVLAAIVAIYGGFNVYSKYQAQDQDAAKAAAKFGFAFVFITAAGFIVEAVFID